VSDGSVVAVSDRGSERKGGEKSEKCELSDENHVNERERGRDRGERSNRERGREGKEVAEWRKG